MENENIKPKENVRKVRTSTSKKRKKGRNKRKKLLILIIVLLIILVGVACFLTNFKAFDIQDTIISGTERYSKEEINSKFGIKNGNNIFMQMYSASKINYSDLSYIDNLKIRMASNNKIKFEIKERESLYIAFNKENNKYYRLDKNGYILEECNPSTKTQNEVIMLGISFDNEVVIGSKISDVYLNKIESYLIVKKEYEYIALENYGNITKVKFDNSLITLTLNDKLDIIIQNDSNLKYKMSLLQGIIGKLTADSIGTIDMTKNNPIYSPY